jgi:threonine/homoserine/homoserine lactone efflux protein
MPDAQQLWMFALAGVLLKLTPGPDVLFIVNQSLRGGLRAGVVAAWGITAGCLLNFNGLLIFIAWALAAAWLAQRTRLLQRGLQNLDRLAGCMFVGFGLKLALTDAPAH